MFLVHSWCSAKEILKTENIDVIITDLNLPDIDEKNIVKELSKIDIIKIVVLSENTKYSEELKSVVDDFIFYGDCNEITIRKSIINVNKIKRTRVLKNRIKQNLEMVPNKI
jgi:DNA-binding NtrC family response regulator